VHLNHSRTLGARSYFELRRTGCTTASTLNLYLAAMREPVAPRAHPGVEGYVLPSSVGLRSARGGSCLTNLNLCRLTRHQQASWIIEFDFDDRVMFGRGSGLMIGSPSTSCGARKTIPLARLDNSQSEIICAATELPRSYDQFRQRAGPCPQEEVPYSDGDSVHHTACRSTHNCCIRLLLGAFIVQFRPAQLLLQFLRVTFCCRLA